MRRLDATTWECRQCGVHVVVASGKRPALLYLHTSEGHVRLAQVEGEEVHRCPVSGRG